MAKDNVLKMQKENITICDYCGAKKEGLSFVIGASKEADWVMIEGTGKMCCPGCWEKATKDGQKAIDKHCESMGYPK